MRITARLSLVSLFLVSCSALGNRPARQGSSWSGGALSVVSRGGAVLLAAAGHELAVILDASVLPDTKQVVVAVSDMYSGGYLVETADPLGRYLPTVRVVAKDARPVLRVDARQITTSQRSSLGEVVAPDLRPLMRDELGTTTLGELPDFLAAHVYGKSINLLLVGADGGNPNQSVRLFRTPGTVTILVVAEAARAGGADVLMAPARGGGTRVLVLSTTMETLRQEGILRLLQGAG
ncbi:MAG TPA: hypothetical protein VJ123_07810 [Anaerolineales bacterium]|nr:hypothetical protein [Anaerolineales bacterium]